VLTAAIAEIVGHQLAVDFVTAVETPATEVAAAEKQETLSFAEQIALVTKKFDAKMLPEEK
jgi:hypothetical protein